MKSLVLIPLLALSFTYVDPCSPNSRHVKKEPQPTDRIYDVSVIYPKFQDVPRVHDVDGVFEPVEVLTVTAAADGEAQEILVNAGDRVNEGDPVVKLSSDTLNSLVETKRARIKELEIRLAQAKASFQGMAVPDRPVMREEVDFLDEEPFDDMAERRDFEEKPKKKSEDPVTLKELVELLESRIEHLGKEVQALEGKLKILQHASPATGVVTKIFTSPKNHVRAGNPLIEVSRLDPMAVAFDLPRDVASFVDKYCKVSVSPKDVPDAKGEGTVFFISPNIDQKNATIQVRAEVSNPDFRLKGGQLAAVHIETRKVDSAMAVPKQAVVSRDGKPVVFVVRGNFVKQIGVRVVRELVDDKVEIVAEERVAVDDPVVVNPPVDLMDAAFVRLLEEDEVKAGY